MCRLVAIVHWCSTFCVLMSASQERPPVQVGSLCKPPNLATLRVVKVDFQNALTSISVSEVRLTSQLQLAAVERIGNPVISAVVTQKTGLQTCCVTTKHIQRQVCSYTNGPAPAGCCFKLLHGS